MARLALWCACVAVAAGGALAAPAFGDHGEPYGAGYGIADANNGLADVGLDVAAPAFPGAKAVWAGTCDLLDRTPDAGGVGSPSPFGPHCIDHGVAYSPEFGTPDPPRQTAWEPGSEPSWRLDPVGQAGAHPDATVSFWLARSPDAQFGLTTVPVTPDGDTRDVRVRLPAGVIGDPTAVAECPSRALLTQPPTCPPESQVGVVTLTLAQVAAPGQPLRVANRPVYLVEARDGDAAEFVFSPGATSTQPITNISVVAEPRTDGDFGIDTIATRVPGGIALLGQTITLWGVPWAASHDRHRAPEGFGSDIPLDGFTGETVFQQFVPYDPSWGEIRPFFYNPTECAPDPPTTFWEADTWQLPDVWISEPAIADVAVSGCEKPGFGPDIEIAATTSAADAPSGLDVDLELAQNTRPPASVPGNPNLAFDPDDVDGAPGFWKSDAGLGASHLKDTVVTLPAGLSVNPSGATGLRGCTDVQIGLTQPGDPPLFDNEDPFDGQGRECPDGSRIGTVEVTTPVLEEKLAGAVVLGTPKSTDPASGEMLRLFLVVRNRQRGILAKLYGTTVADRATGRLTTTFANNPRLPVSNVELDIRGGPRGLLATPQTCGAHPWTATFTPWTAAHGAGGVDVPDGGALSATANCAAGFSPSLIAGTADRAAGKPAAFELQIGRPDGQQWLRGVEIELPKGLLASIRHLPKCSDAQAGVGACPAASRVGTVDAAAGAGDPFVLERKGDVYLTEGYKGAPLGLAVRVPVQAGPFRGRYQLSDIIVRQALQIDRRTAQATAVSDPLPLIHHGIPLRARDVVVSIDRPGFTRNATSCAPKQIDARFTSVNGAVANASEHYQATGCASLDFAPKLRLRLTGRRQMRTGRHPGVRARVTQQPGEAAIDRARVVLPRTLALDPDNAQALCEFSDGTRPDPESHCPPGSRVGFAKATSPLLNDPLRGPVFFVKNIRIDPDTGNEIRTLPMIVVALRGEIPINLRGESSTTRNGRLVNTFDTVPDAPVDRFDLRIAGGSRGILAVTRTRRSTINLCRTRGRQRANTRFDAHNGKSLQGKTNIKTPCRARRTRAARRHAKRGVRKHRTARHPRR